MRRAAFSLSIALLGALVFLAWMHPTVLWPTNVGWLLAGEDRGQAAVGLAAYLRAGNWPGLHEPLLDAPEGLPLLFTDSIPLLGLLFGGIARWLPAQFQLIGAWYLICVLLQATFATLLVRRHTADPLASWLGAALLTLFPVLLNRFGHASLCAQWLLLWALWIFIDPARARRPAWWVGVVAVAALVHSYLLLMVGAIWASALLRRLACEPGRLRAVAEAVPVVVTAFVLVALHGVFGGHYVSTGTYGTFTAALDSWWNPANPDFTALLPSSPQIEGRGFEGFQYLGAGLLALALVAGGRALRGGRAAPRDGELGRLAWLLPAFAVLALVAVGPMPMWRESMVFAVALPQHWIDALDAVRASGRLAWPITYTLVYVVIASVCRRPRATLLLGGALALQIVDLMPMLSAVRATSARADDPRMFVRTRSPAWAALIARSGSITFEPPDNFRDLQLMEEIGWRAVSACRPLGFFYASRRNATTVARLEAEGRAFHAGRLDPARLYILLDGKVPPSLAGRASRLDGVMFIPPSAPPHPSSCVVSRR